MPSAGSNAERNELQAALEAMPLDPDVSRRTLGQPHAHLGLEPILASTKRLLAISRGEQETDDRDSLVNQTLHGPEDLIPERLL